MIHGTWVSSSGRVHRFVRFTAMGTIVGPVVVEGKTLDHILRQVLAWFEHDHTLSEHVPVAPLTYDASSFMFPIPNSGAGSGRSNDDGTITVNGSVYTPLTRPAPLDVNVATVEELAIVPGLGPARAAHIVAHRSTHGPFAAIEGLADVTGLPRSARATATPWLTTRSAVPSTN